MSNQVANVHDAFFKQAMSDPKLADIFLREHLPADVVELLSPEPAEPVPASFVDEDLRQHHSDLLFRVRLKAGSDAFAYVVVEHKSSPDEGARLQLLRYVVRILTHWYEHNKPRLPLPPVLTLLAHQGPERWEYSCESADLFGSVPAALSPYLPTFRHALIDLPTVDDRELSTEVRLRASLKALKYIRRRDLPECIDIILAEAPLLDDMHLVMIVTYLDKGSTASNNEVQEALLRLVPDRKEKIMGWITQPYYDKGMAVGEAKGRAARGAELLTRILEKRFGTLPGDVQERISAADVGSIEEWVDRVIDAPDLKSVFDSH